MATDASIPLRAAQFQIQTPGESLQLQQVMQNMRMQEAQFAEQQRQNQLRQQMMQSKEARAQQQLAMDQAEERKKYSKDQLETAWKAYELTPGSEEIRVAASRKAWLESLDEMEKNGTASAIGLTPDQLMRARTNIPNPVDIRMRIESLKDIREDKQLKAVAEASGPVPLNQVGQPQAQPTGQPQGPEQIPQTTDPTSGAVVRPYVEKPIESREIQPNEIDEEQPGPGERNYAVKDGRVEDVLVEADKPQESDETPDSLRIKAEQEDARAERLLRLASKPGNTAAKAASEKAKAYRSASVALEARQQADEKQALSAKREKRISAAAEGNALRPEDANFIADQILNGNAQAGQGFARNQQGKAMIARAITDRAAFRGLTPTDVNAKTSEWRAIMSAQQAVGHQQGRLAIPARELEEFIPLAQKASDAVPRANFVPINKLMRLGREQWSPEQSAFEAANRSVINAFAQVASRGVPTVHNTEEAEHMLNTAQTAAQYKSVLKQLRAETDAALRATVKARGDISESVKNNPEQAHKGIQQGGEPALKPLTYEDPDKEKRYQEWKRNNAQ